MPDHVFHQDSDDPIDVLLVEDNPGDIRLVQEAFKVVDSETSIHPITNGDDAIDFLTQQAATESSSLPDIVLLDLNLPGRDGCEVLEAISNDSQLKSLPVLVLTSSRASEDVERCYDTRANAYLTKPGDIGEFNSLVKSVEEFWFGWVQPPPLSR